MDIKQELEAYRPWNEQEARDREAMLFLLDTQPDIFSRENRIAHFTASCWLLNEMHDKVLMAYHKIYRSWSWLGGHVDGERDLRLAARREALEESGAAEVRELGNGIFSVELLTVDGHEKNESYVSSHLHLNVTYLMETAESELPGNAAENGGVKWFTPKEAVAASTEPWMAERIYKKLNEKMNALRERGELA